MISIGTCKCKVAMKTYSVYKKGKAIKGEVRLPASKSISNRLLVIKALAQKDFKINNLSESFDTQLLEQLIDKIQQHSNQQNILRLDAKNAGTVLRFLTAYLSIKPGNWLLTGSDEMKKRPIKALVNALSYIGAQIKYCEKATLRTQNNQPVNGLIFILVKILRQQ